MKKLLSLIFALSVGLTVFVAGTGDAEAARFGGGRSFGMQRQSIAPRPAPTRQAAPASAPQTPKRNWAGPIAGLAAGLGIAALLSHFGLGQELASLLTIALIAMAVMFVFRLLTRRSTPPRERHAMQYAGQRAPQNAANSPTPLFPAGGSMAGPIPAGFDSDAFLRVAKLNFVRLQAANDAGNLDDLREFVTPEVFAELSLQIEERAGAAQQTDVVTLEAELLEVLSEGRWHIASVRFTGMIREAKGATAEPFAEIWHLVKPVDDSRGWAVAGVQQEA